MRDIDLLEELGSIPKFEFERKLSVRNTGHFCLHCRYRKKGNRKCYCIAQKSSWTPEGYKRIQAHDDACGLFKLRDR